MTWWLWLAVGVMNLVTLDRVLLAAERRGWVYWRRSSSGSSRAGTAFLGVQALFEPDKGHVLTELRREADHIDVPGDDAPLRPSGFERPLREP